MMLFALSGGALHHPDEQFGALVIDHLHDRAMTCPLHTHSMMYYD